LGARQAREAELSEVNLTINEACDFVSVFQGESDPPDTRRPEGDQQMTREDEAFALPERLEPDLDRVLAYWNGLKRGENDIPFWDDVKLSTQAPFSDHVVMIEAFENPLRFRFDLVGEDVTRRYGATIAGKFTDEVDLHPPIDGVTDQCQATVERRVPTYFRHIAGGTGYSRLILPLWGNGHIEMLIGAACFAAADISRSGQLDMKRTE
jgi:hypothetical protein